MLKNYFDEDKYEELKSSSNEIYKALEIVTILFSNDKDKGGLPYLEHLLYVYKNVYSIDEKVVALLHDTMEDKDVSKSDLLDIGFSNDVVDAIEILTRNKKIDYKDYIENIIKKGSIIALNVKLADLENNMDLTRIKKPTIKDYERVEKKYAPSYEKILNRLKEMEK